MSWGLLIWPAAPTPRTGHQPQYVEMFSLGVVSSKKANNPRLHPIKGQDCILLKDKINSRARLWVLVKPCHSVKWWLIKPTLYIVFYIWPRNSQGQLWSDRLMNGTLPCKLISTFISTYSRISRDPEVLENGGWKCHSKPTGNAIPMGMFWAACRAFKAAWLSEQILMNLSDLTIMCKVIL